MKNGDIFVVTLLILTLLGLNGFFVFKSVRPPQSAGPIVTPAVPFDAAQAYILPITESSYLPVLDSNVPKPVLSGKSALVYDARSSRFLFSKNVREKLPIASLTKVMTAVVIVENLNLNEVVTVGDLSLRADGVKQDLFSGERITVGNLLNMMLISSSNEAAYALASYARTLGTDLVVKMNEKAAVLEMGDSNFLNPAGLDDRAQSTAYDLLKLVRYSLRYPVIWNALVMAEMMIPSEDGAIVHHVKNTNQLLGVVPNITGGKTGYTDGALGCMILMVDVPGQNDTIVSIVLGSQERFSDTRRVVEWVTAAYKWK